MSIYKEIESTDKVFGRTRKVSDGLFSDGFELIDMYIDETDLESSISGWIQDSDSNTKVHQTVNILESGAAQGPDLLTLDASETLEYNKNNWTDVVAGDYYTNVYNQETVLSGVQNESAESQFTISYGCKHGYGSLNDAKSTSVTKAIYNQYRNILLGPGDSSFTFSSRTDLGPKDRDSIFVINFTSNRVKEKFDAGNLEFRLQLTVNNIPITRTFRDDSRFTTNPNSNTPAAMAATSSASGRVHEIVKGSLIDERTDDFRYASGEGEGVDEGFGLAYPDLGIIILNPYALACEFGSAIEAELPADEAVLQNNVGRKLAWYGDVDPDTETNELLKWGTERNHQNYLKLFHALKLGSNFKSRSTELVPSKHYFIRVKNADFNYSNNPTYVVRSQEATELALAGSGSDRGYWLGRLRHEDFVDDPKTYITTVGLYNEDNDLVAVAKLSVPILKSFDTEALIKVKLDF